jgi:hypothetical protein
VKLGEAWEVALEVLHKGYQERGLAYVYRCHPLARMNPGNRKLYYAEKGPPDFTGVLAGGVPVAFEAKEIKGTHFPFAKLPGHQARALDLVDKMGGRSFIALRTAEGKFVVPWRWIRGSYVAWAEKRCHEGSVGNRMIPFDLDGWLPILLGFPFGGLHMSRDARAADLDGDPDDAAEERHGEGDDTEE